MPSGADIVGAAAGWRSPPSAVVPGWASPGHRHRGPVSVISGGDGVVCGARPRPDAQRPPSARSAQRRARRRARGGRRACRVPRRRPEPARACRRRGHGPRCVRDVRERRSRPGQQSSRARARRRTHRARAGAVHAASGPPAPPGDGRDHLCGAGWGDGGRVSAVVGRRPPVRRALPSPLTPGAEHRPGGSVRTANERAGAGRVLSPRWGHRLGGRPVWWRCWLGGDAI